MALRAVLGHLLPLERAMDETIQERYLQVKQRIERACVQAERRLDEVKLIVVTKGHSSECISEVVKAGALILGENYPEETLKKMAEIKTDIHPLWHMIGHLQSRKIKMMHPSFSCIHSVDSFELAQKLNHFYEEKNAKIDVLIEVNISGEESKYGFDGSSVEKRESLISTIEAICSFSHIKAIGLMTMPPYADQPTQNEACYNLCREYCEKIQNVTGLSDFKQLSMGTSADFETAIKSGATYIRVGEAIMGKRKNPKIIKV